MRSVTSVGKTDRRLIRLGAMLLAILPSTGWATAVGPLGRPSYQARRDGASGIRFAGE